MSIPQASNQDALRTQLESLRKAHGRALSAMVRRQLGPRLRQRLDSDDLLQEVLLEAMKLWVKGPQRPTAKDDFLRWMAKIIELKTHRLVRFHLQAHKRNLDREVRLDSLPEANAPLSQGRSPSSIMLESERRRLLHEAIEALSPKQKEVVTLVHLRRIPVQEAAKVLGKTPNATSVLLFEALERLGRFLKAKGV